MHHVSYSSGSYLPVGESFGASCVLQLQILPPYREGSGATITYSAVSCGSCALNIKKSLASLAVQLNSDIPNTRMHISKVPGIKVIMGLQDVRADNTFNACNMCGQTAIVQRRSC
jgi:copper chaperone CopZ